MGSLLMGSSLIRFVFPVHAAPGSEAAALRLPMDAMPTGRLLPLARFIESPVPAGAPEARRSVSRWVRWSSPEIVRSVGSVDFVMWGSTERVKHSGRFRGKV